MNATTGIAIVMDVSSEPEDAAQWRVELAIRGLTAQQLDFVAQLQALEVPPFLLEVAAADPEVLRRGLQLDRPAMGRSAGGVTMIRWTGIATSAC